MIQPMNSTIIPIAVASTTTAMRAPRGSPFEFEVLLSLEPLDPEFPDPEPEPDVSVVRLSPAVIVGELPAAVGTALVAVCWTS